MRYGFVILVIVCSCSFSSPKRGTGDLIPKNDTCFYDIRPPADLDVPTTAHYDTMIVRKKNCKVQALRFGSWGTESSYTLLPSDTSMRFPQTNLAAHFFHGQQGIIDITTLPVGKYNVSLAACGNGGSFGLEIK